MLLLEIETHLAAFRAFSCEVIFRLRKDSTRAYAGEFKFRVLVNTDWHENHNRFDEAKKDRCSNAIQSTYAVLTPAVRRTAAATLKLTIVANRCAS